MARIASQSTAQPERSSGQTALRRSPRKRVPNSTERGHSSGTDKPLQSLSTTDGQTHKSTHRTTTAQRLSSNLREIRLPANEDEQDFETAITSAQRARPSTKPSDIDSIIMPLSKVSIRSDDENSSPDPGRKTAKPKPKASTHFTSRFVMKEANCVDNYSDDDEDEDEPTDLSGFIVDDDAEISFHISSGEDESEQETPEKKRPLRQTRRRLQRGHRRVLDSDDSDKENGADSHQAEIRGPVANDNKATEVIDLTSSPEASPRKNASEAPGGVEDPFAANDSGLTKSLKGLSLFDSMMRLSPPRRDKTKKTSPAMRDQTPHFESSTPSSDPQTPTQPQTPPRLTSPSKLLSPSKRTTTNRSPHRQSSDAFWDHNTVNDWNDSNSPKKAPLPSPNKINPLSHFAIYNDSTTSPESACSDTDSAHAVPSSTSSPPLPSPCASPSKPRTLSPEKATRLALLAEKRAAQARKTAFNATKHALAADLLSYLDEHVTNSQLANLSASTGGVQVQWSKTLRSTAGRANWRRSVTRLGSGSPVKGSPIKSASANGDGAGAVTMTVKGERVKVEHFASIELADKVIDGEERLVNTLAHEFCHLANFMVSGVRDQPHGASFRAWADKATGCLARAVRRRDGDGGGERDERVRDSWASCKVTTKHSYEIEWKYLWGCVGREQSEAMRFLNVLGGEGCGAEYGRHSKSIDTEKMRCGRCKGRLVQLRPTPRAAPKKAKGSAVGGLIAGKKAVGKESKCSGSGSESSRSSAGGSAGAMAKLKEIEVVELSD